MARAKPPTQRRDEARAQGAARVRAAHLGPERRRPLILDAAFGLFLERGYEGTSMDAIAAAAGVTKPVVYACYPSKEELFAALLQREEQRVLAQIAAALPRDPGSDNAEQVLVDGFTAFLEAVAASPRAYRVVFLGEGGLNAAVAARVRAGREQQVEAIAALAGVWLERRSRGDARPAAAETRAMAGLIGHLIAGLAEAGARAFLADPERWTPHSLGRVLGGLAAHGQTALRWDETPELEPPGPPPDAPRHDFAG